MDFARWVPFLLTLQVGLGRAFRIAKKARGTGGSGGGGKQACDWQCYLDRYKDLQSAFGPTNTKAAAKHYDQHGKGEGRDCTCAPLTWNLGAEVGQPGKVDELYTLGAPGPFRSTPKNLSFDCMTGNRMINVYGRKEWWAPSTIDMVPAATSTLGLKHFKMDIGLIDQRYKNFSVIPCSRKTGKDPQGLGSIPMHFPARYEEAKPFLPPRLSTMTTFARSAYRENRSWVNDMLAKYGYRVAGTATSITDWKQICHLTQNNNTLGCTLTFHGTEGKEDWIANFKAKFVDFCGLDTKVHLGFRDQLRRMASNPQFQASIRPQLPYCKTLAVVGHSMGGAVGELLAACLANAPGPSNPDYAMLSYIKETPKLFESFY